MEGFLDQLLELTSRTASFMFGPWMIALLVLTGLAYTVLTRGIQVRRLWESLKLILFPSKATEDGPGDISPFAALMTALAATVGNGNIAGVATAIATGGPGAPLWMWVTGFFGMATKYGEGFLGVRFRRTRPDGSTTGGPMYYCRDGIRWKGAARFLGAFFAVAGGLTALIGTGNMAQSNSMALAFNDQFGVPFWVSALVLVALTGMVIIGGIKRIGAVAEKLVPAMIIFYLIGAVVILVTHVGRIPAAFILIFQSAFSAEAAGGALIGTSVAQGIRLGVSRGVLSNESGLGSAAIAQAASKSQDPTKNGLIAMTGTFIDTILVNTMTTLCIVVTGFWAFTDAANGNMSMVDVTADRAVELSLPSPGGVEIQKLSDKTKAYAAGLREGDILRSLNGTTLTNQSDLIDQLRDMPTDGAVDLMVLRGGQEQRFTGARSELQVIPHLTSTALTANAFGSVIPFGGYVVAIASFLFGYSTLLGWSYYGEQCWQYLFGLRSIMPYRYVFLALLGVGAVIQGAHINIVWYIGDTFNALMAVPNLIGMWFLSGYVGRFTAAYFKDREGTLRALKGASEKGGKDPFL